MFRAIGERYRKNRWDLQGVLLRRYPDFVLDKEAASLETGIPVFVFHAVERGRLESQLRYLAENGYSTLRSADELLARLRGEQVAIPRSVLLTFDDGLESLSTAAFPLLRAYNMAAVAFIVPEFIGLPGFCTWEQLRELHESGVIDAQSHTLFHRSAPHWPRIVPCLDAAERCQAEARRSPSMADDYRLARERIEDRLRKPVRHLGYPDYDGTAESVAVSRQTGYVSNFWGLVQGRGVNQPGDDSFHTARLLDDYIFRLPGRGRRSLASILADKWRANSARRLRLRAACASPPPVATS